jgi:hypothetical protein
MILFRLLAIILLSSVAPATAGDAHTGFVERFTASLERIMDGAPSARYRQLEALYRRSFDIPGIARAVAPPKIWNPATQTQRTRIADMVVCRMALGTAKRRAAEKPREWSIAGTRTVSNTFIVALRLQLSNSRQRTVQFILASVSGRIRIVDLRSENGRLVARLAEEIERDTAVLAGSLDVESWLGRAACRR